MLCGSYDCSGGSPDTSHLRKQAPEGQLIVVGPLAIVFDASSACRAEVDGVTCVFDGRLYPPSESVSHRGHDAETPAELIARRYRNDDSHLLRSLRGRFSLVVWDEVAQRGLLSCDLLATNQIFLLRGAGCLLFATELHELLRIAHTRPGPDEIGFLEWLAGGGCPAGRTLYEGVSRLGPGELIELQGHAPSRRTYWQPRYEGTLDGSPAELAIGLREKLAQSVQRRVSPHSTGVVLSGGLDSSIVAAFAAPACTGKPLRAYSAVFPGAKFDESSKIQQLTMALGIESATFTLEPRGTIRLALEHTKRWGLPLTGPGALVDMMMVAEAARAGIEVALDGQTGDEVLGLSPYLIADRLRRGRLLGAFQLAGQLPLSRTITAKAKRRIVYKFGVKGALPYRLGRFINDHRTQDAAPSWLLPSRHRQYAALADRWAWKAAASGPRWWRYLADVLVYAPHRELRLDYMRHRAAAVGIVNESPLYDFDVIDYCLRLPPELAFDARFTRPIAREAMRGLIPDAVRLQTQKADFAPFCAEAITGADAPGIEQLIGTGDAELGAYADMGRIRSLWQNTRSSGTGASIGLNPEVWRFAAAECWLRFQADPGFVDEMLDRSDIVAPVAHAV
jgi:asparagine synthase (glutamine-hydrolysing)